VFNIMRHHPDWLKVKIGGGKNLSIDLVFEPRHYLVFRFQGQLFFLAVMKKYGGHVLP